MRGHSPDVQALLSVDNISAGGLDNVVVDVQADDVLGFNVIRS